VNKASRGVFLQLDDYHGMIMLCECSWIC